MPSAVLLLFVAMIVSISINIIVNRNGHSRNIRSNNTVITATTTNAASTNDPQRYRYMQQMNLNATTNGTESNDDMYRYDDNDDTISADTILISLSIINTLFFVLPTTIRYAIQKRQCLQTPTNVDYDGCICSFPQLQNAISNSNQNDNTKNATSVFIICPATTIAFLQPLNITSKRFLLTCGTSRFINTQPCRFIRDTDNTSGNNFINYIIGAPTNVTIEDITFYNGYSSSTTTTSTTTSSDVVGDGNGGAIYMTGGYMTLQNVIFDSNFATNNGGAIYINTNKNPSSNTHGNAIVKIRSRTTFLNNAALNGGSDIYIVVPGVMKLPISLFNTTSSRTTTIHVECIPSTLLNRPRFCNYNNDPGSTSSSRSIIIEDVTTETDQSKYTNCYNTNLIETRC